MTWASRSVSHSVTRAGLFLKKQLWIWPIIAVVVLSVAGFTVRHSIESTIKGNLTAGLKTLLTVEVAMLENYFKVQESNADSLAKDIQVRDLIYKLIAESEQPNSDEAGTLDSDTRRKLGSELAPAMSSHHYVGYFVTDKSKTILAASSAAMIGQQDVPEYDHFLTRTLEGETVVCPPFPSVVMIKTESGDSRMGQPTMYVSRRCVMNRFKSSASSRCRFVPSANSLGSCNSARSESRARPTHSIRTA